MARSTLSARQYIMHRLSAYGLDIFIGKMQKRESKSGIINLSSASVMVSFTGCVHYSATKKFDDYLSQALAY